jgi:predicted helicase
MDAYKKEPGGKEKLKERNSKWINDDYVKFIRLAEHMIAENGEGILGFITNHGYLDNPTFRGMRWHLLKAFDKIYVLDLHGNSKKREVSPDGLPDKNVFDIQQGVAIIIGVKKANGEEGHAKLQHDELWGGRASKSNELWVRSITSQSNAELAPCPPHLLFGPTDAAAAIKYNSGFSATNLFSVGGVGICSKRDEIAFQSTKGEIERVVNDFYDLSEQEIKSKFNVTSESRDQQVAFAKKDVVDHGMTDERLFQQAIYRPFDPKWTYYTGRVRGFLAYPVADTLKHMRPRRANIAIVTGRQGQATSGDSWDLAFLSDGLTDLNIFRRGGGMTLPLYLRANEDVKQTDVFNTQGRTLNFDPKIYAVICKAAGLTPSFDAGEGDAFRTATGDARPTEVKVFDYIYGVLHSPAYRATYAEFLKIDFPRIPYPRDPETFAHVSDKGEALRRLHLMEAGAVGETPFPYLGNGDDVVASGYPKFEGGKVLINAEQHFDGVPEIAWGFHIGGYQPAQKWLKDRRGRTLSYDDIGRGCVKRRRKCATFRRITGGVG